MTIRAHFDGRVIVPDEPVDLPVNKPIELEWRPVPAPNEEPPLAWLAALDRIVARAVPAKLSDEALRRESIYSNDDTR